MTETEISFPTLNTVQPDDHYYILFTFKIDGTYYLFAKISSNPESLTAFSYNPATDSMTKLDEFHGSTNTATLRTSRIYFAAEKISYNNPDSHYMLLTYFDTGTGKFATEKKLYFNEVTRIAN